MQRNTSSFLGLTIAVLGIVADSVAQTPDIRITEFVASNSNGLRDEDGDRSDWIEIQNLASETVDLKGWALSTREDKWDEWQFPKRTLEAGELLVVFASGKDRTPSTGELHTNFKLSKDGEYLALFDAQGVAHPANTYVPKFPPQRADISYGHVDGQGRYWSAPTPGRDHEGDAGFLGFVEEVQFNRNREVLNRSFNLRMSSRSEGIEIRYTLDGSAPTSNHGELYKEPIPIEKTTVVRAAGFKGEYLPSDTISHTFILPAGVLEQQPPDDYPEEWGERLPAHYTLATIDGEVTSALLEDALEALPKLSLAIDPTHLFDPDTGIYMNTEKDGVEWERPVSIEWIGKDRANSFQVDAGIRIQGRSSRKPMTTPKHSFRVLFKGQYGPSTLEYPLFDEDGPDEFNTLVLRATSNHSWLYPRGEERVRAQYIRDPWAKDSQRAMGYPAPRTRYVHLFLNGLYWGLYNVSERPDAAFMAERYGGEKEDYDVRKGGETVEGDRNAWRTLFNFALKGLSDDDAYRKMKDFLDMDHFIDYMILSHYSGNTNWDFGNWYAAAPRDGSHGFRFFGWDMESTLARVGENRVYVNTLDRPTALFHQLRKNAAFRERYAERIKLHLTGDGALSPKAATERFLKHAKKIEQAIIAESARWGDYRLYKHAYRTGPFVHFTRDEHWYAEQERLVYEYFPERTAVVLEQYRNAELWDE